MSFNKNTWGKHIWNLLHIITFRIKEENFTTAKPVLVFLIKTICSNLPCPECAMHSTNLLKLVNFDKIITKHELVLLIFNFHNTINIKLKKPTYKFTDMNIYNDMNIHSIYYNFTKVYYNSINTPQMMQYNFNKNLTKDKIKNNLNLLKQWY